MAKKYFDGVVPEVEVEDSIDEELKSVVLSAKKKVENCMDNLRVADAIDEVFEIFRRSNKYIDETMPWKLAKEDIPRLKTVIYNLLESIRVGAVLLKPFLPDTSDKIFKQLNTENKGYDSIDNFDGLDYDIKLNDPSPLFARIEKNVK